MLKARAIVLSVVACLSANVITVVDHFSDGMVLPRNKKIILKGKIRAGLRPRISLGKTAYLAKVDKKGNWTAEIGPLDGGQEFDLHAGGRLYKRVATGEVWLGAGQSNMAMTISDRGKDVIEVNPDIRIRNGGKWYDAKPENHDKWSITCYWFARTLNDSMKVPVGMILAATGATNLAEWMDPWSRENCGVDVGEGHDGRPAGGMYNKHIKPIVGTAINGIIWYQGEYDRGKTGTYAAKLSYMILGWRKAWNEPDLPWITTQLQTAGGGNDQTSPSSGGAWARLREAMRMTLAVKNTGMAVTFDSCFSLHPSTKNITGRRLAVWAMGTTYKQDRTYSGPLYMYWKPEASKARVYFRYTGSGLVSTTGGTDLNGFCIKDEAGTWHWAKATIDGHSVVLQCDAVPNPSLEKNVVSYAYADKPLPRENLLYNKERLPASPFMSDSKPPDLPPDAVDGVYYSIAQSRIAALSPMRQVSLINALSGQAANSFSVDMRGRLVRQPAVAGTSDFIVPLSAAMYVTETRD